MIFYGYRIKWEKLPLRGQRVSPNWLLFSSFEQIVMFFINKSDSFREYWSPIKFIIENDIIKNTEFLSTKESLIFENKLKLLTLLK